MRSKNRKIIFLIFLGVLLALPNSLLLAKCPPPPDPDNENPSTLKFDSYEQTGHNDWINVDTIFFAVNGKLRGKYYSCEYNWPCESWGNVIECNYNEHREYQYECEWIDCDGRGYCGFNFFDNNSRFEGYWRWPNHRKNEWNGKRIQGFK